MESKKTVEVPQKIIDMTEVPDEKFTKIVDAFNNWKSEGMTCGFGYWEDEALKEYQDHLTKLFEKTMINGILFGSVATMAGAGVCMIADKVIKDRKAKKYKEELEEHIEVVEDAI